MTRTQKKCFLFSVGLHGLLGVIVIGGAAFRDRPVTKEMPILTLIPSRILDAPNSGGDPIPSTAPPSPHPAPPTVQPQAQPVVQPVVQPRPQPRPVVKPPPEPEPHPIERPRERDVEEEPVHESLLAHEIKVKPTHRAPHEIHVDLTPITPEKHHKITEDTEAQAAASAARAEARKLKRIAESMADLANGVQKAGAAQVVINLPGQGGGEAFAGYETVIFNAYYHAWITPDNMTDKLAGTVVKIVVARDGSIISTDIVTRSGDSAMDRSVERALRAVRSLPPFPSGAQDEQRSFLIRFDLVAKEGTG